MGQRVPGGWADGSRGAGCWRESHGSRKLEKNSVRARGEGGVTIGSGVAGGGKDGKVAQRREPVALFPPQKFNSAAAAQEEGVQSDSSVDQSAPGLGDVREVEPDESLGAEEGGLSAPPSWDNTTPAQPWGPRMGDAGLGG